MHSQDIQNNQHSNNAKSRIMARKNVTKKQCEISKAKNDAHLHFLQTHAPQGLEGIFKYPPSYNTNTNNTNNLNNYQQCEISHYKKSWRECEISHFSNFAKILTQHFKTYPTAANIKNKRYRRFMPCDASRLALTTAALTAFTIATSENKTLSSFTLVFDDAFTAQASESQKPFSQFTLEKITKAFKRNGIDTQVIFSLENAYSTIDKNKFPKDAKLAHCHGFLLYSTNDIENVRIALKSLNKRKISHAFNSNADKFKRHELEIHKTYDSNNLNDLVKWCFYAQKSPPLKESTEKFKKLKQGVKLDNSKIAISRQIRAKTQYVHDAIKHEFDLIRQQEIPAMKNKKTLMTVGENEICPLNKNLQKSAKQHRIFVGNFKFDGKEEKPVRIDLEQYLLTALSDLGVTNAKAFLEKNKDFQDDAKRIIKHGLSESFTDAARFAIVQFILTQPAINLAEKRAKRSDLANSLSPVNNIEIDEELAIQAAIAAVSDDILNFDDLNFNDAPPENTNSGIHYNLPDGLSSLANFDD